MQGLGQFKLAFCVFVAHLLILLAGLMYVEGGERKHIKPSIIKVEIIFSTPRLAIKSRASEQQSNKKFIAGGDLLTKSSSENTNVINDIDRVNEVLQVEQHVHLRQGDTIFENQPKPRYPVVSKKLGEEGTVIVRGCIEENGSIRNAVVINGSGYKRLDAEAIETVRKWTFSGSNQKDKKIMSCYKIPIKFVLEG